MLIFRVFSTKEEVVDQMVRPIVDSALTGFNCTLFAYGHTSTGRTYTMESNIRSEESSGIVRRSLAVILKQLDSSVTEFSICVFVVNQTPILY